MGMLKTGVRVKRDGLSQNETSHLTHDSDSCSSQPFSFTCDQKGVK